MPIGLLRKIQSALTGATNQTQRSNSAAEIAQLNGAIVTAAKNRLAEGEDLASMDRDDLLAVLWPWDKVGVRADGKVYPLLSCRLNPPERVSRRTAIEGQSPPNMPVEGWTQSPLKCIPPEVF